jgi:arylsulfatase A-like enzyme
MYKNILLPFALSILTFSAHAVGAPSEKHPNIIYIQVHDMGKGMLSAYGQKHFTTPHIDSLIHHGVGFDYAFGGSTSAFSRASLFTGYHDTDKHKWRITKGGAYLREDTMHLRESEDFVDGSSILLPENDPYLPQIFGKAGYVTAQIGLLGIGKTSSRRQMTRYGWDYYYGYLDHTRAEGFYPTFLFENGQTVPIEGNTRIDCGRGYPYETESEALYKERHNMEGKKIYAPDLFINKAREFMREFKDKPFFLLYSTPLPAPISAPVIDPETAQNDLLTPIEKEYASMIKILDRHVGMILSELRDLGLEENTLLIFSSDNGHHIYYLQKDRIIYPFRNMKTGERFDGSYSKYYSNTAGDVFNGNRGLAGLKESNLNGGINIPLIFYWKGKLKHRVCEEIVSNCDILPTMADLLNIKTETKKDGISILPALMKGRKLPENRIIIISSAEGPAIIANDGWKLRYYNKQSKYELYNIRKDPEEKYDIIRRFPQKAEELKKKLLEKCNGNVDNGTIY